MTGVRVLLAALVTASSAAAQTSVRQPAVPLQSAGVLLQGQTARVRVMLRPGARYRIDAQCAADCSALDLALRDHSDYEVATDRRGTTKATIALEARATGEYVVLVQMRACAVQPCEYRVAVHRVDGAAR